MTQGPVASRDTGILINSASGALGRAAPRAGARARWRAAAQRGDAERLGACGSGPVARAVAPGVGLCRRRPNVRSLARLVSGESTPASPGSTSSHLGAALGAPKPRLNVLAASVDGACRINGHGVVRVAGNVRRPREAARAERAQPHQQPGTTAPCAPRSSHASATNPPVQAVASPRQGPASPRAVRFDARTSRRRGIARVADGSARFHARPVKSTSRAPYSAPSSFVVDGSRVSS